jgi:sugar O-acyltransferase (sialic acid O-acetyltransferase NeuD family)
VVRTVVVGIGGMGREIAGWLDDAGRGAGLIGFVDDDPTTHGRFIGGLKVLGPLEWLHDAESVEAILGIGSPPARLHAAELLQALDVPLASVVHPTAIIGHRVSVGQGAVVGPAVVASCDVSIGRAAIVNYGALLGHDTRVDDLAFVAPGAHVAGSVIVGEEASIGIGASIIQGVSIGRGATVGAGAVVIRDVAPGSTVVGVPARPLN